MTFEYNGIVELGTGMAGWKQSLSYRSKTLTSVLWTATLGWSERVGVSGLRSQALSPPPSSCFTCTNTLTAAQKKTKKKNAHIFSPPCANKVCQPRGCWRVGCGSVGGNSRVIRGRRTVPVSPKCCIPFEIYLMRQKQECRSQAADARC